MKKEDARTLSSAEQELIRRQVVRMKKQGNSFVSISKVLSIHRNTVSEIWQLYKSKGIAGLIIKKRGRKKGEKQTLDKEEEKQIRQLLLDKSPEQYKLTFALWTRQAVQELIKLTFGIEMPIRTVGEYLRRWNFTPQKPLKRTYEQQPKKVKNWLDTIYPEIHKRCQKEKAEIHWGDETGIRSDSQHGRSYAPKGKTPAIVFSAKRSSINMISTITNQGKLRFMIYSKTMNAERFITFLKQLIKDSQKKIFLILDNLRVHHAYLVQDWIKENIEKIELFFLPAYSPELNPDEYLNNHLKSNIHSKPPAKNNKVLENNVKAHMEYLQKKPMVVRNYFLHPKIEYAA